MACVPGNAGCRSGRAVCARFGARLSGHAAPALDALPGASPELLSKHGDQESGVRDTALPGAGYPLRAAK